MSREVEPESVLGYLRLQAHAAQSDAAQAGELLSQVKETIEAGSFQEALRKAEAAARCAERARGLTFLWDVPTAHARRPAGEEADRLVDQVYAAKIEAERCHLEAMLLCVALA